MTDKRRYNYVEPIHRGTKHGFVYIGDSTRIGFSDCGGDGRIHCWKSTGWNLPTGEQLEQALALVRKYAREILGMEVSDVILE